MAGYANFQPDYKKYSTGVNIFKKGVNRNRTFENKSERLKNGIKLWASWYRYFPHLFVKDYIGINLKLFQSILIYFMMHENYFMYLASRGQGKTFLTSIFCCTRAILYPGTKIVVASGIKSQAREVVEKIDDMRKNSPNLAREISELRTNANDSYINFHNGSWIKIVASNDNARGKRANLLIVDEFRLVDIDVIKKVLRKFLADPRHPKYLDKPEYAHLSERNKELYLSSAWYRSHWSWNRFKAFVKSMSEGRGYFVVGLPYQLSIREGLLMKEQVIDEMMEDDFDPIAFSIEMGCLFFGESERAYFKFEDLNNIRSENRVIYPRSYYNLIKDKRFIPLKKSDDEIRVLACDVAGMAGDENDSSAFILICMHKRKGYYRREVKYIETMTGVHTGEQSLRIRKLYAELDCDYIALDGLNIGLAIFDNLVEEIVDNDTGEIYPPLNCKNDEKMSARCKHDNAPQVIYSIKASSESNSQMSIRLREDMRRGKMSLLVNEREGKDYLSNFNGYHNLDLEDKVNLEMPYNQTTALVNETINLSNNGKEGNIKLEEPSGSKKDRFSALLYGNYVCNELEKELENGEDDYDFVFTASHS